MSYPSYGSILQPWVMELPIRHQGVLLAAVRGCDGQPKENTAKPLIRAIRGAFLNPADRREIGKPSAFMTDSFTQAELKAFLSSWDQYPIHFVDHLIHACQVIGFKHPDSPIRNAFNSAYFRMVRKLHLLPELETEMDARLTEDRIALYEAANAPD